VEELDVRAVRRAVLGLERRLNENLSARVKARPFCAAFLCDSALIFPSRAVC
jgi:hypothetical protein